MNPLYTIDVAHPPRHPDEVEEDLIQAWSHVRNTSALHVLKIVHGYGSHGKGGATREHVRDWVFKHRHKFRNTINGEDYTLYNAATVEMRAELGAYDDDDLNSANPGVIIVWVK
jgi:hypothetical protein